MITSCSQCTQDVEDDEVSGCTECEIEGLCSDCLGDHDCYVEDYYDSEEDDEDPNEEDED